jgi:CRP-like cAMP-binding protein
MARSHHAKGEVLFRLGDPGDSMHLVLAGSVRILELDTRLGPGSVVGEIVVQRVLENERRWREAHLDTTRGTELPAKSS